MKNLILASLFAVASATAFSVPAQAKAIIIIGGGDHHHKHHHHKKHCHTKFIKHHKHHKIIIEEITVCD